MKLNYLLNETKVASMNDTDFVVWKNNVILYLQVIWSSLINRAKFANINFQISNTAKFPGSQEYLVGIGPHL